MSSSINLGRQYLQLHLENNHHHNKHNPQKSLLQQVRLDLDLIVRFFMTQSPERQRLGPEPVAHRPLREQEMVGEVGGQQAGLACAGVDVAVARPGAGAPELPEIGEA